MEFKAIEELEAYIQTAHDAGCPMDQVQRFIRYGYIAQPKQLLYHAAARECDVPGGPVIVGLGGARGPGKSHAIMAQIGLDDCQRVPELKFLFLRKVQKAARESFEDLIQTVFRNIPYKYNASEHRLIFENGSRIIIGGYKDDKELDGYLGIQYDGIAIEEATLLTEDKLDKVLGSQRTAKDQSEWIPRMYVSSNPGGVGHQWFRKRLVIPAREHKEIKTRFIFSTYKDNKFLNQEYREYLENLKGPLGKAWRDGDWDVFEGQAFPAWSYDDHVISYKDFPDAPEHWVKWRAIDWGNAAPFCCLWLTREPDTGRVIIYREAYQVGLTVPQQARMILDMTPPNEKINVTYADPSMWAKNTISDQVTSTAQVYADSGVFLTKADNDRLSGKRKVDELLANLPDGRPGMLVRENCSNFIRTFPVLTHDPLNVEDVNSKEEDHAYDTLKYGLSNLRNMIAYTQRKIERRQSPLREVFG